MGETQEQAPVKLLASVIYRENEFLEYAEEALIKTFGAVGQLEEIYPFEFTDYYENEFGKELKRKILCFEKLVELENISDVKLRTNKMEMETCLDGKRRANIDPGYLTEAKLALLTTKDFMHRIYLGQGIFAENTLFYRNGSFCAYPWTYPDYAASDLISYFNKLREIYRKDLSEMRG